MSRALVYRVQAPDGRGPWRPGWSHTWVDADAPVGRTSETLMDLIPADIMRSLPRGWSYGCACRSMDALLDWFTPVERLRLAEHGYSPVRLWVDVVLAESEWQLVFARRRPLTDGATRLRWGRDA